MLDVGVKGLIETNRNIQQAIADLHGQPMQAAMNTAVLMVERDAKIGAPVDTGGLRQSISHQVDLVQQGGFETVQGIVGSNKVQAVWMELGTGVFAGHAAVKFPPPSALGTWAGRHGTTGYLVALAIFKAGGLKPRKFLQNAFDKNKDAIIQLIGSAVSSIVNKANGG